MPKKYDSRLVHSYLSYKISDICNLYKQQKIHPQTIRKLIKQNKLEAFEYKGEFYIYGATLKQFFESRNKRNKRTLEFNQFRCGKCKAIDLPLNNTITKLATGKGECILTFGICKTCNHEMNRPYKKSDNDKIHEIFTIQLEQQTTLCNTSLTTKPTHIKIEQKEVVSELVKMDTLLPKPKKILKSNKNTLPSTKTTHFQEQGKILKTKANTTVSTKSTHFPEQILLF